METPKFSRTKLREGYDAVEVDAFVQRALWGLGSRDATAIKADDVRNVRFTPVRLREGYDMGEVDAWLDLLERTLSQMS
jgi:DivIVA domain-containing protein